MNISRFRGNEKSEKFDELYNAEIYRYQSLNDVPWLEFASKPNVPVRIIIWPSSEKIPVDLLYIPREHPALLVGFHGAETRSLANLPKFQFVRSFLNQRKESLLFVADSTLLLHDEVGLAWMVGDKDSYFLPRVTMTINSLKNKMNHKRVILVGHSGGGFMAIATGSQIADSIAISVNGQTVIGAYEKYVIDKLQSYIFNEQSTAGAMLSYYADRLDLRIILRSKLASSRFILFAHKDDRNTIGKLPQFELLAQEFDVTPEEGGITEHGDKLILCNWDTKGHSPHALPSTVIPFIQFAMGEDAQQDISIITSI